MSLLVGLLMFSGIAWSRAPAPESLVVMAYVSKLRCEAQHPKLKPRLKKAFAAWEKRNRQYVVSARKMLNFKVIDNQYKSTKKHDKRFPYRSCVNFIKRLHDPASDVRRITHSAREK